MSRATRPANSSSTDAGALAADEGDGAVAAQVALDVVSEQLANTRRTAAAIVGLLDDEWRIVLTHGNGPQVGAALIRSERASDQVYGQPLDVCDAATQGEIGYSRVRRAAITGLA
ncbi:MAG: hypothetical protein HYY06_17960 [Deltaproteobacteria bacterium]|nr:hypothetical protein [Deltaproteobacteria bacterium]